MSVSGNKPNNRFDDIEKQISDGFETFEKFSSKMKRPLLFDTNISKLREDLKFMKKKKDISSF